MAIEVIMPKVDMDQETGTVVEWTKNNRIIDGAVAARFMADLKNILEAPILIAY